jgi:hypothetical protein
MLQASKLASSEHLQEAQGFQLHNERLVCDTENSTIKRHLLNVSARVLQHYILQIQATSATFIISES